MKRRKHKAFSKLYRHHVASGRFHRSNPEKRCAICGASVSIAKFRKHLEDTHELNEVVSLSDYFMKNHYKSEAHESWYRPNEVKPDYACGSTVHGAPFVKIVYNPVATNRRRH